MPTTLIIKRYLCDICSSMFDVSDQCKIHEARDHSSQEIQAALERNKTYRKYKQHSNAESIINGDTSSAVKRRISLTNDDVHMSRKKQQRISPPMAVTAGDTNGSNSSMLHRKIELLLRNIETRSVNATLASTNSWQEDEDTPEGHLNSLMQNTRMLNQSYFDESQDPAKENHEEDRPVSKYLSKNKLYPLTRLINGKTQCDLCRQTLTQRSNAIRHLRLKHYYVNDERVSPIVPIWRASDSFTYN